MTTENTQPNLNNRNLIVIASIAILIAAILFGIDYRSGHGNQTTLIVLTITPPAQTQPGPMASLGNNIDNALPNLADFMNANKPAQAAQDDQAADIVPTPGPSVTGWLEPTLGKIIIVDGVNRKIPCAGIESNADFNGLTDSQKVLAKDTCTHL